MRRILIVDDEEDLLQLVEYNLRKEGYETRLAMSGEEALRLARAESPDLILLDLMLPGLAGEDVCRILKNDPKTRQIPIVMLTARGEESHIVAGFELGADDYIPKPFSPKVLLARLNAILRRADQQVFSATDIIKIHAFTIHPGRHTVYIQEESIQLTNTEFRLLHLLARRPGWVFTRYQIVDGIRGEDYAVTARAVDVQILGLRKKLGEYGKYIETVRGVGYRLKE